MTEGGDGADGTTVDAVAGQLATRLGAIGETAGAVMRRDVRTAAGGAESIALLVQADAAGAGRIAPATAGEHPAGRGASTPAEQAGTGQRSAAAPAAVHEAGPAGSPRPHASAVTEDSTPAGDARSRPATEPGPEQSGDSGSGRAGAGADDAAAAGFVPSAEPAHEVAKVTDPAAAATTPDPGRTGPGSAPVSEAAGKDAVPPSDPGRPPGPASPGTSAIAVADSPAETPATDPATRLSSVPTGSTPWTPGLTGGEIGGTGQTQVPGSTPWNSGAGSSMPYMPGLPGGSMGSLTPQERPPRGSAPWSRSRGSTHGAAGTVFPRDRADGREPGGRG